MLSQTVSTFQRKETRLFVFYCHSLDQYFFFHLVCGAVTPSIPKIMTTTPLTVLNPLVGSEANFHAAYTYTPLSIACRLGHVEAARLLIQYGANLDTQDEDGESCLIIAAKNGHVECVKLLLTGPPGGKGADMELRERYYGWTALHLAGTSMFSLLPMNVFLFFLKSPN